MNTNDFNIIRDLVADINDVSILMLAIRRYFEHKESCC
jgi:hypothetical protein